MDSTSEREKFLEQQSLLWGQPILASALGRVLEGPPLGADLVFLLVGPSGLRLLPLAQDPTIFGIPLPGKRVEAPQATLIERADVEVFDELRPRRGWARWFGPRDVVHLRCRTGETSTLWNFQLIAQAAPFLDAWRKGWNSNRPLPGAE